MYLTPPNRGFADHPFSIPARTAASIGGSSSRPRGPTETAQRARQEGQRVDLFEYQGKQFFASFDIPVSKGEAVTTVDDAVAAAERIGQYPVVVKAQVHVGGRGKAGGVKLANDIDEVP